jgi:hypothetical protein
MVEEEKGIKEQLTEIREHLGIGKEQPKKEKLFKLPFGIRMGSKAISKKGKVLVFTLKINGNIDIKVLPIINGMVNIGDKFFGVNPGQVYLYNNIPTIILPEWDLEPIGLKTYIDGTNKSDPEAIIIRAIEMKEAGVKKPFGGKTWLWILLIGAAVAYVVFSGGLK